MKLKVKTLAFIICTLFVVSVSKAQTDTCNLPNCGGWLNGDSKKLNNSLIKIYNRQLSGSVITGTVTGNWFRQDSATAAFNRMYAIYSQQLSNLQGINTNTARITTTNNRLVTGDNLSVAQQDSISNTFLNSISSGLTGGGFFPYPVFLDNTGASVFWNTGQTSIFKDGNGFSVFCREGNNIPYFATNALNNVFTDTISGKSISVANSTYSTSVQVSGINSKLAGTLTVSPTGTTAVSGSVTTTEVSTSNISQNIDTVRKIIESNLGTYVTGTYTVIPTTTVATIYSVPANKTFYLTSISFQGINNSGTNYLEIAFCDGSSLNNSFLSGIGIIGATGIAQGNVVYGLAPVKLTTSLSVGLYNTGTPSCSYFRCSYQGYYK